jgi:hypothetical protein
LSAVISSLSENVAELCFCALTMAGSLHALALLAAAAAGSSVWETAMASNPLKVKSFRTVLKFDVRLA